MSHLAYGRERRDEAMNRSYWHKIYSATVKAPPSVLFQLLADLPHYAQWLPHSEQFAATTEVEPYPVQLGSRYHDGRPEEPGNEWWGTVIGFQPPGSLDFHQAIKVKQLRSQVDVHIHYSFEAVASGTELSRWLILDIAMPTVLRPLRRAIVSRFDSENVRTIGAVKVFAEESGGRIASTDGEIGPER
jgi:uncharacterized protein YndB with AHSA1/START domain